MLNAERFSKQQSSQLSWQMLSGGQAQQCKLTLKIMANFHCSQFNPQTLSTFLLKIPARYMVHIVWQSKSPAAFEACETHPVKGLELCHGLSARVGAELLKRNFWVLRPRAATQQNISTLIPKDTNPPLFHKLMLNSYSLYILYYV